MEMWPANCENCFRNWWKKMLKCCKKDNFSQYRIQKEFSKCWITKCQTRNRANFFLQMRRVAPEIATIFYWDLYRDPIVLYCNLKNRLNVSPTRNCSLNLSYFKSIVLYCILKYRLNISSTRPCSLNLSYFRHTVWGSISKDISNISPIRPCLRILAT